MNQRWKPAVYGVLGLALVWLLAWGGYALAKNSRVTAEKVRHYLRTTDIARLTGEARAKALRNLARQLNALTYEERRLARLDREWSRWFVAMTDTEKGTFIEATLPSGMKQALTAFEELPEARRRKAIDDAVKRLREAQTQLGDPAELTTANGDTNLAPVLTDEVRQKLTTVGLKAFYSQSSAQTKAEIAPVLEELQRMMESGRMMHMR